MSKLLTKIYDGMVFNMSTGEVISHGAVTYHPKEDIAHCGGGGGTSSTVSGVAEEFKPQITSMLDDSESLYKDKKFGQVAGQTNEYKGGLEAGYQTSQRQKGLEQNMMNQALDTSHLQNMQARTGTTGSEQAIIDQAGKPVDLSGMRAGALQQAQGALSGSQAGAGARGGLGGSRQALNQASITNDLAGKFAGIDQQAQQMQMQNLNQAVGAEQGQFGRLGQAWQGESQDLNNMNTALSAQGQGSSLQGQMGQATMDLAQRNADSDYTAMAQRIGLFSGIAPKEQNTTKTGGK